MALLLREGDVISLLEMPGNIMVLEHAFGSVSYTHLTLPTNREV